MNKTNVSNNILFVRAVPVGIKKFAIKQAEKEGFKNVSAFIVAILKKMERKLK